MSTVQEQITAALKKLGPTSPGALADHLGIDQGKLGYHVKQMLDAKTLQAAGVTKGRRLALPDQALEAAPPAPPPAPQQEKGQRRGQAQDPAQAQAARVQAQAGAGRRFHARGHRRHAAAHQRARRGAHRLHRTADRADRRALPELLRGLI